nr:flippase-like domain-containing protein [Deltaproteobacteria bacterium]
SRLYFSVSVMLIGIPLTLLLTDVPGELKVLIGIGVAVIIPAMVALGFVIHRGAMATLVGTLRRFRIISVDRAKVWKEKLKEVDRHIRELHTHRTSGTRAGLAYVVVAKLLNYASMIALLAAVGVPLTPVMIIGVLSVGVLISWIAAIVPLGIGVEDGGNYALYALLGATGPQGLAVTMISRARSVAIAIFGLAIMAVLTVLDRLFQRRIAQKIVTMKADNAAKPDATPSPLPTARARATSRER